MIATNEPSAPVEAAPESASAPPVDPVRATRDTSALLAPWVAAFFLALPTLVTRFPPMTDLPMHAAMVAVIRHFNDPAWMPVGLYELNFGHPNQLFHWVAAGLSFGMSVEMSCKVVVAVAQAGTVLAAARLADYLGVSRWTALLVSPLALGWTFFWGLVANLCGFGLFLLALPTLDRAAIRPSLRGALASSAWMVLLYFAHESVMVVACSAVFVFVLARPLREFGLRGVALRTTPIVVAAALFIGQQLVQHRLFEPEEATVATAIEYGTLWAKIHSIPATVVGATDVATRTALLAIAAVASGAFLAVRLREPRLPKPAGITDWVSRYRFELVAALNGFAYLAMPFGFAGGSMFNHRFFHPAYAIAVLVLAPRRVIGRDLRLAKLLAATVPLAFLFATLPQFAEADACNRELDLLLPQMAMNSSVAYLEADPHRGMRSFATAPEGSRALVARGGRLIFSLSYSVISPVRIAHAYRWSEISHRIMANSLQFIPEHDMTMFRYLIVHSRDPAALVVIPEAIPEARFVDSSGEWSLYESRLPVVPPMSPEPPLSSPPPETLHTRLDRLVRAATSASAKEPNGHRPMPTGQWMPPEATP